MRISDLERMLAGVKLQHGDLEVLCGVRPVGAIAVLPAQPPRRATKVLSIVAKERRRDPTRASR